MQVTAPSASFYANRAEGLFSPPPPPFLRSTVEGSERQINLSRRIQFSCSLTWTSAIISGSAVDKQTEPHLQNRERRKCDAFSRNYTFEARHRRQIDRSNHTAPLPSMWGSTHSTQLHLHLKNSHTKRTANNNTAH